MNLNGRWDRLCERYDIYPELFSCAELKRADVQLLVDEKAVLLLMKEPESWPVGALEAKDTERIEGGGVW